VAATVNDPERWETGSEIQTHQGSLDNVNLTSAVIIAFILGNLMVLAVLLLIYIVF